MKTKLIISSLMIAIAAVIYLKLNSDKSDILIANQDIQETRSTSRTPSDRKKINDPTAPASSTSLNGTGRIGGSESGWLASNPKLKFAEELIRSERFEEALDALDEAEALEPGHPVVSQKKGEILLKLENWPDALGAFNASLKAQPDQPDVLFQRAQARIGMEEYAEAITDLERLLEVSPNNRLRTEAEELLQQWNAILNPDE